MNKSVRTAPSESFRMKLAQQLELAASEVLSGVIAVVLIILLVLYALLHFAEL